MVMLYPVRTMLYPVRTRVRRPCRKWSITRLREGFAEGW